MKTIKSYAHLIGTIGFPLIIILSLSYYFIPTYLPFSFYLNWGATLACIILIFLRSSSTILGQPLSLTSLRKRYVMTWTLQILLFLSFIFFCHFLSIIQGNQTHTPVNIHHLLRLFCFYYGLYPWTSYTLVTISIATLAYHTKKEAYFSSATLLPQSQPSSGLGVLINNLLRASSLSILGVNLAALILICMALFYQGIIHIHPSWSIPQIIISLLFMGALYFIVISKPFNRTFFKKISLFQLVIYTTLITSLLLGLIYGLLSFFAHSSLPTPSLLQSLLNHPWQSTWQLCILLWYLGWLPLISLKLAKYCYGLSIRASVIMLLSLPVLFNLIYFVISFIHPHMVNFDLISSTPSLYISLIAIALLFFLITSKRNQDLIVNHRLPLYNECKMRPFTFFQKNTSIYCLITLIFYFIGGVYLLNLLLTITILPTLCYPCLLVWPLVQHRFNLKQHNPDHK